MRSNFGFGNGAWLAYMKTTFGDVRHGGEGGGQDDEQRDGESGGELHAGSPGRLSKRGIAMLRCTNFRLQLGVLEMSLLARNPWC